MRLVLDLSMAELAESSVLRLGSCQSGDTVLCRKEVMEKFEEECS